MSYDFVETKTISLREAGKDERWLQDLIAKSPSILGLGEVEIVHRERKQPTGGRIDLILPAGYDTQKIIGDGNSGIISTLLFCFLVLFSGALSVTLSCCCPWASVDVCEEPVTCAQDPLPPSIKAATATPASRPDLFVGKKDLGRILGKLKRKLNRRFISRQTPSPPRACCAQAVKYSSLPSAFVPPPQLPRRWSRRGPQP